MDDRRDPIHLHHPAAGASRRVRVAAAVVRRDGRLLLTQRPPGGPLALQWELPGGKIEEGESPEHALERELREELGVRGRALEVVEVSSHDYPHGLEVEIVFVRCELESLEFAPSAAVHAVRWVEPATIDLGEVLAGDREFLRGLGARG
ncbi:MAG TPA: NUDIX domain-containing protein [Candidatus Eisenbacteria bacterium]|jgi:8-oxo-dGTP diphosphatase